MHLRIISCVKVLENPLIDFGFGDLVPECGVKMLGESPDQNSEEGFKGAGGEVLPASDNGFFNQQEIV